MKALSEKKYCFTIIKNCRETHEYLISKCKKHDIIYNEDKKRESIALDQTMTQNLYPRRVYSKKSIHFVVDGLSKSLSAS